MATIPLGDFDAPRVSPRTNVSRVDTSGSTRAARAMERAGETLQGIASNQLAVEGQKREEEQRRREALARVDMVNAGADYEIRVAAEQAQFTQDVTAGRIQYRKAGEEWSQRLARLEAPQPPDDADEVMRRQFAGVLDQTQQRATLKVDGVTRTAEKAHFEASAIDALNKNVQVAGMPGGDTGRAIARNQAMLPLLRAAGYDKARSAELIRKADQAIDTNEAKGLIEVASGSVDSLRGVLHELEGEDGRYVTALDDPNQRLVLANDVRRRIAQLQTSTQAEADKREEAAKRIVSDVWKQATSGVRPSTDMLTNWATAVEGTAAAPEFKAAMGALQDVQGVLRESPETQAEYVQGLRAKLTEGGGTPADQARIDQVERVIEASNKQPDTEDRKST